MVLGTCLVYFSHASLKGISQDYHRYNPKKLSGLNAHPKNIKDRLDSENWEHTMMKYHEKMKGVCFELIQNLSLDLDLPKKYFDTYFSPSFGSTSTSVLF